jgi:hypothetical protein
MAGDFETPFLDGRGMGFICNLKMRKNRVRVMLEQILKILKIEKEDVFGFVERFLKAEKADSVYL